MPERTVRQEEIKVANTTFTVTHIPTATSGSWYTVHDACEVWGAVAIDDLSGEVIGWREPPPEDIREQVEKAIKVAFGIPVHNPKVSSPYQGEGDTGDSLARNQQRKEVTTEYGQDN